MASSNLLFGWMSDLADPAGLSRSILDFVPRPPVPPVADAPEREFAGPGLPAEASSLVVESRAFLHGDAKGYFRWVDSRPRFEASVFGRWRMLLFFISATRAGMRAEAERTEHLLLAGIDGAGDDALRLAHSIHAASRLMGRGDYRPAVATLEGVLDEARRSPREVLDCYWEFRARSVLGTSLQALGRFEAAREELERQGRIVALHRSPYFEIAWKRRHVSLLVERDEYAEARARVEELLALVPASKFASIRCLVLQERLRIAFADDDLRAAARALAEIESILRDHGLSASFVTLVEERCELELRTDKPAPAARRIAGHLLDARDRDDMAGRCVCGLYLARASLLSRHHRKAEAAALEALDLAERNGYAKSGIRARLLLAAICYRQGRNAVSAGYASRAGSDARTMGLAVQAACARILSDFIAARRMTRDALLELIHSGSGVGDVFHALDLCGFIVEERVAFELVGSHGVPSHESSLREAIKFVMATPAAFWFPEESVLVGMASGEPRELLLDDRSFASRSFRHLLSRPEPTGPGDGALTIELVHRLRRLDVDFHPVRHRAACQAALARLRSFVGACGFSLSYSPGDAAYRLVAPFPWYRVITRGSRTGAGGVARGPGGAVALGGLSQREREIAALLREKGRLETKELRDLLGGVTRQTLHPMLTRLEEMGIIEKVPNGPRTWYRPARPSGGGD